MASPFEALRPSATLRALRFNRNCHVFILNAEPAESQRAAELCCDRERHPNGHPYRLASHPIFAQTRAVFGFRASTFLLQRFITRLRLATKERHLFAG